MTGCRSRAGRWALLLPLLSLWACGPDRTLVIVSVDGLPGGTSEMRAAITLDGRKTRQPERFDMALGTFGLELPPGAMGSFTLDLGALDSYGCVLATGHGETEAAGQRRIPLHIDMVHNPVRKCEPWARRLGGSSLDYATGVAVDGSGRVLVTGYVQDTVDFGDGNSTQSAGGFDAFLAKFSPSGDLLWAHRFGGPGQDSGQAVTTDADGNVLLAGYFEDTVSFGGDALQSAGKKDIFLAKYSPAGEHLWSRRMGGPLDDQPNCIAQEGGNVFVAGEFRGTAEVGKNRLTSSGDADVFVAGYTAIDGQPAWSAGHGGSGFDSAYGLAVDRHGGLAVVGAFENSAAFGGAPLSSQGMADAFIARYDTSMGLYLWSQGHGGPGNDAASAVVADSNHNLMVTGYFAGDMVGFGGDPLRSASQLPDVFLARYDSDGMHLWSRAIGGPGDDEAFAIALDGGDSVVIGGSFSDGADFGGGPLHTYGMTPLFNAFAARYTAAGTYVWARSFGGPDEARGWGVALDGAGDVLFTGDFAGQVDFLGLGPQQSAGNKDIFLLRFAE